MKSCPPSAIAPIPWRSALQEDYHLKAALCKSLEGSSAIEIVELAPPVAQAGEVVVAVKAAALNFMDTLITRGKYQVKPELPFSPAAEIAGVVEALGAGVTQWSVGQRVCGFIGYGGARELVAVKADRLIAIPDNVTNEVAAGICVTFGTAMHGLGARGELARGETIAILGASGGAGLAAIEIAKRLGGRVIAVASSPDKLKTCRTHGADELVNYKDEYLKDSLMRLTNDVGVDVVYDCVGGPHAQVALRAMAWGGRFLVVGFASGEIPRIPLNLTLLKGCDIRGVFWGEAVERDRPGYRADMSRVLDWINAGTLAPHIHATFPLEQIGTALGLLERREAKGKVVLTL